MTASVLVVVSIIIIVCLVIFRGRKPLSGPAVVIDGDTIELGGERIRVDGLDALEMGQTLEINGKRLNGGRFAKTALQRFLTGKRVSCRLESRDRWGRGIGRVYADGTDVAGWMIERGHGAVDPRFSQRHIWKQRRARLAKRGIWNGRFVWPWDWRKGARLGAAGTFRCLLIGFLCLLAVVSVLVLGPFTW